MTARVTPLALSFQTDLDRLISEPTASLLRLWPAFGLGLLAALVTAAALLPVDVVITASGRIAADAPSMLLRPNARAVLQELLVRPGDVVVAGQVLARLDATMPMADRAALTSEQRSLWAEIARYEAEITGAAMAVTAPETAEQVKILGQRRAMTRTRMAAPQIDALTARAARLGVESDLTGLRARQSELARTLRKAQDDRAVFVADQTREATEALPRLRLRLTQIDDALSKANRLTALTELVAPRAGVVISVAPGGVGAIMAEGEALVVLIPSDARLLAEISINSADLGRVAAGDLVTLKVDAFPYRRFGTGEGRIDSLGPVSFTPEGGSVALHPARVAVLAAPDGLPPGAALLPGMTLSAEVKTGTRTVLDYFLDPLERGLSESLREP